MADTLAEKVNKAIDAGDLARSHGRHYRKIAKELDNYETTVDTYAADLVDKVGGSHKTHKSPQDLYMALIRHIAGAEDIEDADKLESFDGLNDKDMDKIRNHLSIHYGLPSENDLRKLLDTVAGGEYKTDDEVREAFRQLAHRRGQNDISKASAAWTSEKEWSGDAGKGGTHHTFMQMVSDHHNPEGIKKEVDTYKTAQEAVQLIGSYAQKAYQAKKEARHKE